jgi:hypothetical protein
MEIDHLVLIRKDRSQLKMDDVEAVGDVRQLGAIIDLPGLGTRASVDRVDDQTTSSRIGEPFATGQLTVYATEL